VNKDNKYFYNNKAIGTTHFARGAHDLVADWCRHLANSTKHNVTFNSAPLAPLCENVTALSSKEDRATVTGNIP